MARHSSSLTLPVSMLAGFALGFIAGRALRAESDDGARRRAWISDHEPQVGGRMSTEQKVDDMAEDSFPASDPPSYTASRAGKPSSR